MAAKPLNKSQLEDAKRLRAVFELRKNEDPSLSQERLAHACGWKTQGSVNQYMHGKIPLNLNAVQKFAEVLQVSIEDISPDLSRQIASLAKSLPKSVGTADLVAIGKGIAQEQVSYPDEIQEVIDLMLKTDDRGRLKMKLAAVDAFELHNSHISRTQSIALDDDEIRMIEKRRRASKLGKDLIDTATETAHEDEQFTKSAHRA
jgi:transcriptional regulator with XRE-family HTH domain